MSNLLTPDEIAQLRANPGEANPAHWIPRVLEHVQAQQEEIRKRDRAHVELTRELMALRNRVETLELTRR